MASNPKFLALPEPSVGHGQEGGIEEDDDKADLCYGPHNRLDTSDCTSHGSLDETLSDLQYNTLWILPGSHLQATPEAEPEVIIDEPLSCSEWDVFYAYHSTGINN